SEVLRGKPTTGVAACCARAANGHPAAAPPTSVMKSRRFTGCPSNRGFYPTMLTVHGAARQIWINDVRFGSKADIEARLVDVRFTPKADIGTKPRDVRFAPEADIGAPTIRLPRRHG